MKPEELIEICKQRGELKFLYKITKHIAETDSITEEYSYVHEYSEEYFNEAIYLIDVDSDYSLHLKYGGLPIYEL